MLKQYAKAIVVVSLLCVTINCRKHESEIEISDSYENISNDTLQAAMASISIDGQDNLYVVWKSAPWTGPYGSDSASIRFSMKTTGKGWTESVIISEQRQKCDAPSLVVDKAGNVHIVWIELHEGGYNKLYYRARNSVGEWQATEELVNNPDYHVELPYLSIDSDGGVHVTWCGWNEIFYLFKPYNESWENIVSVSCVKSPMGNPANTEIDSENSLHLVYQDYTTFSDIWYLTKASGGSWNEMVNLSNNSQLVCWNSRIALDDNGHIAVTWHGYGWEEQGIYYSQKLNDGEWSIPDCIFAGYGYQQMCIDNSGTLYLFFVTKDIENGNMDVYYGFENGENSWTEFVNVTKSPGQSGLGLCRNIVVDANDDLHLIWEEDLGGQNNWDILYKKIEGRHK